MSDPLEYKEPPPPPRPWQPRFGISTMLLTMLIVSIVGVAASHYVRALQQDGRTAQLMFIVFTLAAPLLLVVAVSSARALFRRR